MTKGLADVVEYAFSRQGRPNGYILGEEGGGAYFAGLRYGEGRLHTKHMGVHKVFWQGPSLGIDVGGDGSKTMMLVYNIHYPEEMFERFGGVDGSAYVVGGVGVTFLTRGDMVLAPIRSGLGLRLGANIGYLKYTPYPDVESILRLEFAVSLASLDGAEVRYSATPRFENRHYSGELVCILCERC